MFTPEEDSYVDTFLKGIPDDDLLDFADRLYAKLSDQPTWPINATPEVLRAFLPGIPGICAAIESLLTEDPQKIILDSSPGLRHFATKTKTGVEIVAATDKGGRPYKENEDRIAIHIGTDFAAVIDGIGGYDTAGRSATILADALLKRPHETARGARRAQERIRRELKRGGACYASARLTREPEGTWTLHRDRKGDCRVSTIDPHSFEITSQTDDEVDEGGILSNAVEALRVMQETPPDPLFDLSKGTIVLLTSDGVHKKVTLEECAAIIGAAHEDIRKAMEDIWNILTPRMTDHRSIVLMRVPRD